MAMDPNEIAAQLKIELEKERARIQQLQDDKDTLIAEFTNITNFDDAKAEVQKRVKDDLLPSALIQLDMLMNNADSESVRASIAKWVAELVITGKVDTAGNSELGGILRGLQKNDKKPQPDHED